MTAEIRARIWTADPLNFLKIRHWFSDFQGIQWQNDRPSPRHGSRPRSVP
jgi:hypothetical protein